MLRQTVGPKKQEITGRWKKNGVLKSFIIYTLRLILLGLSNQGASDRRSM